MATCLKVKRGVSFCFGDELPGGESSEHDENSTDNGDATDNEHSFVGLWLELLLEGGGLTDEG